MLKPLRPSSQVVVSMPGYRCYCCQDTGLIIRQEKFFEGASPSDVGVMCRACGAAASRYGEMTKYLDGRVTREQCKALHQEMYEDWLGTIRKESQGMRSAAVDNAAITVIAKPMPEQKPLNPAPEKPITELDGFRIGDRVRITLKRFSAAEQKEIARNDEVPVGAVGEIVGFEKSGWTGLAKAVIQIGDATRTLGVVWLELPDDQEAAA